MIAAVVRPKLQVAYTLPVAFLSVFHLGNKHGRGPGRSTHYDIAENRLSTRRADRYFRAPRADGSRAQAACSKWIGAKAAGSVRQRKYVNSAQRPCIHRAIHHARCCTRSRFFRRLRKRFRENPRLPNSLQNFPKF
jgi:hypothetical protein